MNNHTPQNDMPNWDHIPDDAYSQNNDLPPQDFDEGFIPDDLTQEDIQQPPFKVWGAGEDPQIYSYPRVVREFNKNVKFGLGVNLELAKKASAAEAARLNYINSRKQEQAQGQQPVRANVAPAQPVRANVAPAQPVRANVAPAQPVRANVAPAQPVQHPVKENAKPVEPVEENIAPAQAASNVKRSRATNITHNLSFLDSTNLLIVIEHFANWYSKKNNHVKHIYGNVFELNGYRIRINHKENKWYNIDTKHGNTNALSLARELIAIHEDINLNVRENFTQVCSMAVKEVSQIQKNIEKYSDIELLVSITQEGQKNQEQIAKEAAEREAARNQEKENLKNFLNSIPMKDVAEWLGATPYEDGIATLWKFYSMGGNNVNIDGQRWKNWNQTDVKGGYGALTFMKHYISNTEMIPMTEENDSILYKKAVEALTKEFGGKDFEFIEDYKLSSSFSFPHILPGKTKEVIKYLHEVRYLPEWIINKQISNGLLFAGFLSNLNPDKLLHDSEKMSNDKVWATFLAPSGMAAEVRNIGTNPTHLGPVKGLVQGSDKTLGGHLVKAEPKYDEKIIAICEAAIDANSYSALYPGRSATSLMGVTVDLAVEITFEALEKDLSVYLSLDNDVSGNRATYQYHKAMLAQVEEESDFLECLEDGSVKYFELGIQVMKETLKKNKPYFFEIGSTDDEIACADLFAQTLLKEISENDLNNLIKKGIIKLNNICPIWQDCDDAEYVAKSLIQKLEDDPRFYFYPSPVKEIEDNPREKEEHKLLKLKNYERSVTNREKVLEHFERLLGPEKFMVFKNNNSYTETFEPLVKDWNEWMKYQIIHRKEVRDQMAKNDQEFAHYAEIVQNMPRQELGNNHRHKKLIKP